MEFVKIDFIETEDYTGDVYNLETGTHEYIAEDVVVHNCPHYWATNPEKWAKESCPLLWMGE